MYRRLVTALWVATCLVIAACAPAHAQFDVNLVVNGHAEDGMAASSPFARSFVPGWAWAGDFSVYPYSSNFSAAHLTDPGPPFRGANFFAADPSGGAAQLIDVSGNTSVIKRGGVTFTLSAYLGGYQDSDVSTTIVAGFRDASGGSLGSVTLGPVTPDQRKNVTGLFFRTRSGIVPNGTSSILVAMAMTGTSQAISGYADNISLVMHAPKLDVRSSGTRELVLGAGQKVALWFLNGYNVTEGALVDTTLPPGWQVAGSGDFNFDGVSDLVLQNPFTGQVAFWFMNGTNVTEGAYASQTLPDGWRVAGVGDFDNDGNLDLALYNPSTQQVAICYMAGTTVLHGTLVSLSLPPDWQVAAAADIDGDGHTDLVLQNAVTGQTAAWYLVNNIVTAGTLLPISILGGTEVVAAGDFDFDGVTDIVIQNRDEGKVEIWYLAGVVVGPDQLPAYVLPKFGFILSEPLPPGWSIQGPR